MRKINLYKIVHLLTCLAVLASLGPLSTQPTRQALASPSASVLDIAQISASELECLFSTTCTSLSSTSITNFTLTGAAGSGFMQSRRPSAGQPGAAGAGLYSYRYQFDLSAMVGASFCIDEMEIDFGPVVPLDYDEDGSLEHVYVISSGGSGSIAPSSVEKDSQMVKFSFSPGVCAGAAAGEGDLSFIFGMASPFNSQEITAAVTDNMVSHYDLQTRAPDYSAGAALKTIPGSGQAGAAVRLVGSGYVPGGYAGTIRWDGTDVETFDIPTGGAFSIPYTIPAEAAVISHTLSICSGDPCTTGEFEQLASATFDILAPELVETFDAFLPYISSANNSAAPKPFTYIVDESVEPSQDSLPGLDGVTARPLAAVKSPNGIVSTFVANEIMVQTGSQSALDAFLARTGGEVIFEADPGAAGIAGLDKMYLVRVDLSTADLSTFTSDITALMPSDVKSAGQFAYSSEDGVSVFAMAAAEAADGLTVAVNWLGETGETTAIPDDSLEAPNGPGGYNSNAYNWAHFAQGTTQDIGVPEAWNLLEAAGRTSNRVDIAILDGGFSPNADFPSNITYVSVIPFVSDPRDVEGFGSSVWHGTHVLQTAMAVSDNDYGIVGVAAPIGYPIALFTSYDYVVSIGSVFAARANGADILNMSYSADVPAIFAWTALPFDAATRAVSDSGVLLFASAGNDGFNVDAHDCFLGICWEETFVTPCENAGVICVGGLDWDSQSHHPHSSYGAESVDIWAPYTVYRGEGPDHTNGGTDAGYINGTSFSSPYAASVAALIWAGDPSLSAGQVWGILRDTAHTSPDSTVNRYVNAYAAVLQAVDVGASVEIMSPGAGSEHSYLAPLRLMARVNYVATQSGIPVTVEWRSNRDGIIHTSTHNPGAGEHTVFAEGFADLSSGAHTITVNVTAGDASDSASVSVTLVNTPPSNVEITAPATGGSFCPGVLITFRGTAFDEVEPIGLPESGFTWRSSRDGSLGSGRTYSDNSLSQGSHTITLRATDEGGLYAKDSIALTILNAGSPACTNLPPDAAIQSPNAGSSYFIEAEDPPGSGWWYATVTFTALVGDAEDPVGSLTVEWLSDETIDIISQNVDAGGHASMTAHVFLNPGETTTWHNITLRVTDTDSNISEDSVLINVFTMIH